MMLGCEDKPPYGPTEHTAALFMDLICKSLQELSSEYWIVSIAIYRVQQFDFPKTTEEWDSYDGILLPGSFSAAYDNEEWIEKLRKIILEEVHGKARPTLGICFGHQVLAHAFPDGEAVKCPAGAQAGRKCFQLTKEGSELMMFKDGNKNAGVDLYYTHGDMVQKLPDCAVAMGGTETVPILAAAYYRSKEEVSSDSRPIAITFQAHPEYASPQLGLHKTLGSILLAMKDRGDFSSEEQEVFRLDAIDNYASVERDSIDVMKTAGILLGWFPQE
jgi:GMP synthase-like glutamine amidotransferase